MRGLSAPLAVLAAIALAGCATREKPPGSEGAPTPTPTPAPAQAAAPASKKPGSPWQSLSPFHWAGKLFPKKTPPPQAVPPQVVGTIKMVNKDDRFVLIDAVSQAGIQPGDLLICIVNEKETANLRASSLRNPPFLIADIASGQPSAGDRVFKP